MARAIDRRVRSAPDRRLEEPRDRRTCRAARLPRRPPVGARAGCAGPGVRARRGSRTARGRRRRAVRRACRSRRDRRVGSPDAGRRRGRPGRRRPPRRSGRFGSARRAGRAIDHRPRRDGPRARQDRVHARRPGHDPVPATARRRLDGRRRSTGRPAGWRGHGSRAGGQRPGERLGRDLDRAAGPGVAPGSDRTTARRRPDARDRDARHRDERDGRSRPDAGRAGRDRPPSPGVRVPALLGAHRQIDPADYRPALDDRLLRGRRRRRWQPRQAQHATARARSAGRAGRARG